MQKKGGGDTSRFNKLKNLCVCECVQKDLQVLSELICLNVRTKCAVFLIK